MEDQVITQTRHAIPVTQFLRPSGAKHPAPWHTNSDDLANKARQIIARGFRFEMEVLNTGQVSLTVTDPAADGCDLHIELCDNQPGLPDAAMERLIQKAHRQLARKAS